eukprot:m.452522 g.452522  ORF g.452522 m.452522 type:complete len:591 (+) comp20347_c0_seq1:358-2130(+)
MSRINAIMKLEFGSTYRSNENDTPKLIADTLGIEVRHLVQMNKDRLPGLSAKARLKAGTELALPYDGTTQTDDLPKLFRLDPDAKKPSKDTLLSLFRSLKKLDTEKIFTHPVTDDEAPLYSVIILKPMTWTQIRKKIDTEYETMQALADDFCLICKNAIVYNDAESEYNEMARRMLSEGIDLIEHFQWNETLAMAQAGDSAEPSTEPFVKFTRKTGPMTTSLEVYPNSTFLRAVPRVGQNFRIPIQVPVAEVQELKPSRVVPVTPIAVAPFQTFSPCYDGSCATVDVEPFHSPSSDVPTPRAQYTDYAAVARATVRPHARAIARVAAKMSIPLHERVELVKRAYANPGLVAEPEPVELAAEAEPDLAADTASSTEEAPVKSPLSAALLDLKTVKATPAQIVASNNEILARLQVLQLERLSGPNPAEITDEESALAAQFRMEIEGLMKTLTPKDLIDQQVVREMLGVQIIDPNVSPTRKRSRPAEPTDEDEGAKVMEEGIRSMSKLWRSAQKMQRIRFGDELKDGLLCDNCGGTGVRWTLEIPEATGAVLCHACGLYQASYHRPRPVAFAKKEPAKEAPTDGSKEATKVAS